MTEVFTAAKFGMYDRKEGVHVKLKSHDLPGTIRDEHGWSIAHHIASAKTSDDAPSWEAEDILNFFRNEKPFPNAIDHWGQTPLHILAKHPRGKVGTMVVWDGEDCSVVNTWVKVAHLLMANGCDPRIEDHRGRLAHNVARRNGNIKLADLLEKECKLRGKLDREIAKKKFPELVKASREGNTDCMMKLLMKQVPSLPMSAEADPLDQALRHKHRDAVFLLLSAGDSLCNEYIASLIPLEVSHHTVGQPAFFPALMRKAYADRLADEEDRAKGKGASIASIIRDLRQEVIEEGDKGRYHFEGDIVAKSLKGKKLLLEAAELGLTLTCQMLSQEDLCLQSCLGEEIPLEKAIQGGHNATAYALCRDLWMTPCTCISSEKTLKLFDDLWERDMNILKFICESNQTIYGKDICDDIYMKVKSLENGGSDYFSLNEECLDILLYWIAKNGLAIVLHKIVQTGIDVNRFILKFSNCTTLHIAAHSDNINIVEYLLHHGARFTKTIGGYTVKEHAALTKRMDCLLYLFLHEHRNEESSWKLEYDKMTKMYSENAEPQLLDYSRQEALSALSEPLPLDQAFEMLKKRGKMFNIISFADFECVADAARDEDLWKDFISITEAKLESITQKIDYYDSRFGGDMEIYGPLSYGYEVKYFDTVHVTLELKTFDGLSDDPDITVEKNKDDYLDLKSSKHSELLIPQNFRQAFISVMGKVVQDKDLCSKEEKMSLVPPFLMPSEFGIFLFFIWRRQESVRFFRMHIKPVLKVRAPYDFDNNLLKERGILTSGDSFIFILLACFKRRYLSISHTFVKALMQGLFKEEKKVLHMLRFLTRLIDPRWSYRSIHAHHLTRKWEGTHGITRVQARNLESTFLKIILDKIPYDYKPEKLRESMIYILEQIISPDTPPDSGMIKYLRSLQ